MTRKRPAPSAELLESEAQILELRRAGVGPTDIARQLHLPKSTVISRYKAALSRTHREAAAEIRDLEAERLDRLLSAIWAKAMRGDYQAVDRALRIAERRAKLIGLDHADGIAERALQLEADKVRLMAVAVGQVFDALQLGPEQREIGQRVLLEALRAADPGDEEPDVVEGEVTE